MLPSLVAGVLFACSAHVQLRVLGHINLLGPPPCHGFGLRDRCEIILREGLADRVGASERVPSGRERVDQHSHVGRHPPHGLARDVLGIFPEAR